MKRLVTIMWGLLFTTTAVAQISTSQTTEVSTDQNSQTVHQVLYHARSPQASAEDPASQTPDLVQFSADTSWSYEEVKEPGMDAYAPFQFMQRFDTGQENDFKRTSKNYEWQTAQQEWVITFAQFEWFSNAFNDSSMYHSYDENGDLTYGDRQVFMRTPSEGATEEYYSDLYSASLGWEPYTHTLHYNNEEGTVSWTKTYMYDADLGDYYFYSHNNSERQEDHYLYEYKLLSPTEVTYWSREYSMYDQQGNTIYMIYYVKPGDGDQLEPSDSTSYRYHTGYAEAFDYNWSEGAWVLDRYTRTYESPSVKNLSGSKVDSVLSYAVEYDSEGDSMKVGDVTSKTIWIYDAHENMILSETYMMNGMEMIVTNRSEKEYELVGESYHQVLSRNYTLSWSEMVLYLYSENRSFYFENDEFAGDQTLYFSEAGDTTSGYKSRMFFEKENMYTFSYEWDTNLHEFIQTTFIVHSEEEPVTQFSYNDETYGSSRYVDVLYGLPAVMNPGPLFIEIGETVDITLSARNPDMSIPAVEVENMPATASFDPLTLRFTWTVDEADPGPMILRAVDGERSSLTEVKFVSGEFTVGTEDEGTVPEATELYQNYPNPFNPTTTIEFMLNTSATVRLDVFNILGQPVSTLLHNAPMPAGSHRVTFDAGQLSSGIYYYQLRTETGVISRKMTLIK